MNTPTRIVHVAWPSGAWSEWSEDVAGVVTSSEVAGVPNEKAWTEGNLGGTTAAKLKSMARRAPGYELTYREYKGICPGHAITTLSSDRGCNCWPCVLEWEPGKFGDEPANPALRGMWPAKVFVSDYGTGIVRVTGFGEGWTVPGGHHPFPDGWGLDAARRDLSDAVLARAQWERVRDWSEVETDAGKELVTSVRRMYGIPMERPVHLNSY